MTNQSESDIPSNQIVENKSAKGLAVYVYSPFCLLRPTTNRIFDMRLCDSLAGNQTNVTIIYPYTYMKDNISQKEIPASYGVKNNVTTRMLLTPLKEHTPKLYRFVMMMSGFTFATIRIAIERIFSSREAVIMSRDAKSLIPAILLRKLAGRLLKLKIVFLAAEVKDKPIYKWVVRNSDGVFAGVSTTRDAIMKVAKVPKEKFMLSLAPVPVYTNDCTKHEAKIKIGYTENKPLIVYTGKLGIEVLELRYILKAAKLLPDYNFLFTGGRKSAVDTVKNYCKELGVSNAIFTGFFNDSTVVRNYQLAGDVLLSYYTSHDHMVEFNYPQKINEYMSTGNPIVTPDFPATQDVLNSKNVYFVAPDNEKELANGIKFLIEHPEVGAKLATQALEDIKGLTFDSKTKELLEFIGKLSY